MRKCFALMLCLLIMPVWALAANPEPVQEFEALLNGNGITLKIPQMDLNRRDDDDWYYCQIAKWFDLTYNAYRDGSQDRMMLMAPNSWRPMGDAFVLLLEYMLGIDEKEAADALASLEYNVIGNMSEIVTDGYRLDYMEASSFSSLAVTRFFEK